MRVLQVVQSYYPAFVYGGPIFSIHYASQSLARRGVDVRVATTNANGLGKLDVPTREPVQFEDNYRVHYYDDTIISRFSWDFTRHLWRDIKSAKVVHLQDVFSTYAAWTMMLARTVGKPILISPRGTFSSWALQGKRPLLKRLWLTLLVQPFVSNTQQVNWHATSNAERDEILGLFPGAHVYVIANGIDCSQFDRVPALPRKDYFARFFSAAGVQPERSKVLVALGRLHPIKAFDVAIWALHKLSREMPDAVLLVAGGDEGERDRLLALIRELDMEQRVHLVGELKGEDKIAFLKGADLFFFPSHSENFGMVALEALASGLPVVASRNTPWAELEREGSGQWVENTPDAFAEATGRLLAQDLIPLRQHARAHAEQFDIATIAARFEAIYAHLCRIGSGTN